MLTRLWHQDPWKLQVQLCLQRFSPLIEHQLLCSLLDLVRPVRIFKWGECDEKLRCTSFQLPLHQLTTDRTRCCFAFGFQTSSLVVSSGGRNSGVDRLVWWLLVHVQIPLCILPMTTINTFNIALSTLLCCN